jgi:hypothetical protein
MTERALLVRHALTTDGRFAVVGIDHPTARVFDTTTGALSSETNVQGARDMVLTSVAVGKVPQSQSPIVAMGTGNGRVLLHDAGRDALIANTLVADASTAVVAVTFVAGFVVALSASGRVTVLRAHTGAVVAARLRTTTRGSALGVAETSDADEVLLVVTSSAECAAFRLPLVGRVRRREAGAGMRVRRSHVASGPLPRAQRRHGVPHRDLRRQHAAPVGPSAVHRRRRCR